jgi:hypothetical protein
MLGSRKTRGQCKGPEIGCNDFLAPWKVNSIPASNRWAGKIGTGEPRERKFWALPIGRAGGLPPVSYFKCDSLRSTHSPVTTPSIRRK